MHHAGICDSARVTSYTYTTGGEMIWLDFGGPCCINLQINEETHKVQIDRAYLLFKEKYVGMENDV